MATGSIKVTGLRELQRACAQSDTELRLGVRTKLREAGEPVRVEAENLAQGRITNLGTAWGRMKVGVTTSSVYVAPASRRAGGSPRGNLGTLLFRAMQDAVDAKADDIEAKFEDLLDDIADHHWT